MRSGLDRRRFEPVIRAFEQAIAPPYIREQLASRGAVTTTRRKRRRAD